MPAPYDRETLERLAGRGPVDGVEEVELTRTSRLGRVLGPGWRARGLIGPDRRRGTGCGCRGGLRARSSEAWFRCGGLVRPDQRAYDQAQDHDAYHKDEEIAARRPSEDSRELRGRRGRGCSSFPPFAAGDLGVAKDQPADRDPNRHESDRH